MRKQSQAQSGNRDVRESKKIASRRAIKNATLDLAIEHGLDNVTVEDISRKAGVSPRTFFNYFETKEDALMQENSELVVSLKDAILSRPGDETSLSAVVRALSLITRDRTLPTNRQDVIRRLRLINENDWLRKRQAAKYIQIEKAVAEATAERRGLSKPDMEARLLAALIGSTIRVSFQIWADDSEQELADVFKNNFNKLQKGFDE